VHGTFVRRGILVFDDAVESTIRRSNDAAVTGGILKCGGENCGRGLIFAVSGNQMPKGVGIEERNVAIDNKDVAVKAGGKSGYSQLNRATGARNVILVDDDAGGQVDLNNLNQAITFVAHHGNDVSGVELAWALTQSISSASTPASVSASVAARAASRPSARGWTMWKASEVAA